MLVSEIIEGMFPPGSVDIIEYIDVLQLIHSSKLITKSTYPVFKKVKEWGHLTDEDTEGGGHALSCYSTKNPLWLTLSNGEHFQAGVQSQAIDHWSRTPSSQIGQYVSILDEGNPTSSIKTTILIPSPRYKNTNPESILNIELKHVEFPTDDKKKALDQCAEKLQYAHQLLRAHKTQAKGTHHALSMLSEKIKRIKTTENHTKERPTPTLPPCDVLIVAALSEEMLFLRALHKTTEKSTIKGHDVFYHKISVDKKNITIVSAVQNAMGNTHSALLTTILVSELKPTLAIMIGVTGGFNSEVSLGDVIIITESFDYSIGKVTNDEYLINPMYVSSPESTKSKIKNWQPIIENKKIRKIVHKYEDFKSKNTGEDNFKIGSEMAKKIHIGTIASGPVVVTAEDVIGKIKSINRKTLGVEMETVGFMLANETLGTKYFFAIKGVSDHSNPDKDKNKVAREFSKFASTQIAIDFIRYMYASKK